MTLNMVSGNGTSSYSSCVCLFSSLQVGPIPKLFKKGWTSHYFLSYVFFVVPLSLYRKRQTVFV